MYQDSGTGPPSQNYKKIRAHFAFDVKYIGRHNTRLKVDRNLIEVPLSSVSSDLVSLQGICLVLLLVEINGLE